MRIGALMAVFVLVAGCARRLAVDPAPVLEVRQAEASLGFEPTRNFHRRSAREAYYVCYATGRLELPESYRGLRVDQGRAGSCRFDPAKLDVFVYPAEALAGRESGVTASLASAEPRRRDFVVAHEDFHEQPGVRQLEPELKEAVSMLAGFLASAEAAKLRGDAEGAQKALEETGLFLDKARRVNAVHDELRRLYAAYANGKIAEADALAHKAAVFARLERDCAEMPQTTHAFQPCPAALNNAGLAFDATYTREYPRVHAIFEETGRDPQKAIAALKALSEASALR